MIAVNFKLCYAIYKLLKSGHMSYMNLKYYELASLWLFHNIAANIYLGQMFVILRSIYQGLSKMFTQVCEL